MDATLEKEVDRLGRSSRVAAGITIFGVIGVGLAIVYATSQLHTLQEEVAKSEARLNEVNAQREQASVQVEKLRKEITKAEADKREYQEQISALKSEVQKLQSLLEGTTDMSRFMHPIDMVDLKYTAYKNPAEGRVLQVIFELRARKVAWKLGGTTPNEGFDSPSFAAYVLQSLHLITSDEHSSQGDLLQKGRMLRSALPRADEPKIGDLVFYAGGYALFFFPDQRGHAFVIGMTPSGIVGLEPNFAPIQGIARPNYTR